MFHPLAARALPNYKLHVRYADGVEGSVDLSHLAGKGVFAIWNAPGAFEHVSLADNGAIRWSEDVELCADALYLEISGKSVEDVFPNLKVDCLNKQFSERPRYREAD